MCVIIYKPAGIALPTDSILETCWNHNPDGAGLAVMGPKEHTITIDKGFMQFGPYCDFVQSTVKKEDTAVYHFRIATSGGINQQACHPFPVSSKVKDLRALHLETEHAFIHNGVISAGSKDLSDTQLYIKDILSKYLAKGLSVDSRQKKIAEDTKGSRTILMSGASHTCHMTGNWITDKDTGLLFSNSSYIPAKWDSWLDSPALGIALGTERETYFEDMCPDCGTASILISQHHGLYECPLCHTVFDCLGNVYLDGDTYDY